MVATKDDGEMRIIILGASGQIGSFLFEDLRSKYTVTGTSRKSSTSLLRFDPFLDDWSALGEADVVINCIGQIQESSSCSFKKIHLGISKKLIENRMLLGDPRIIQISALGASAIHPVEFLRTKGEADDYLLQFPDTVVARPSIVCTSNTMLVKKMLMVAGIARRIGGLVVVPRGFPDRKIQPVMPGDLSKVVEHLSTTPTLPRIMDVTGADILSFREIIMEVFKAKGERCRIVEAPKMFTDVLVTYFLNPFFPSIITTQQYKLLFTDNISTPRNVDLNPLMRPAGTRRFWSDAFSHHVRHYN